MVDISMVGGSTGSTACSHPDRPDSCTKRTGGGGSVVVVVDVAVRVVLVLVATSVRR